MLIITNLQSLSRNTICSPGATYLSLMLWDPDHKTHMDPKKGATCYKIANLMFFIWTEFPLGTDNKQHLIIILKQFSSFIYRTKNVLPFFQLNFVFLNQNTSYATKL